MNRSLCALLVPALLIAGCVKPAEDDTVEQANVLDEPTLSVLPYEKKDSTNTAPKVCTPVGCQGPGSTVRYKETFNGTITALNLSLTWEAANQLGEKMNLKVSWNLNGTEGGESISGPSPLELSLEDLEIPPRTEIKISVDSYACAGTGPAAGCMAGEAAFTLSGSFSILEAMVVETSEQAPGDGGNTTA